MGVDNSTYIGVFLEVPIFEGMVPYTVKVNSKGKEYDEDMQFCPTTGEKLKTIEKSKKERIYPHPYIEDENDADYDTFWTPEYHEGNRNFKYFLINSRANHVSLESCETYEFFGKRDFDEEIEKFKEKYKKYLEYYKSLGYDYKIKWGCVNYAH